MEKIRKGDQVVVLSGRDKGRRGAVLQVLPQGAVLVESLNRVKRHTKPNPQANQPGGIIDSGRDLAVTIFPDPPVFDDAPPPRLANATTAVSAGSFYDETILSRVLGRSLSDFRYAHGRRRHLSAADVRLPTAPRVARTVQERRRLPTIRNSLL
jgi:hypothetical protein